MNNKPTLIIIGAGASGLYTAFLLADEFEITILEARATAGGRIHTSNQGAFSSYIETGAEFIHGDLPLSLALAKQARLTVTAIDGKMYQVAKGIWTCSENNIDHWDEVMDKMESLPMDCPLDDFLNRHFSGEEYSAIRAHVKRYAAGFDLADASDASTKSLYREWSAEDENNYHIEGGYRQLMEFLLREVAAKGVKIHFNEAVTQVQWKKDQVNTTTENGNRYTSNKAVIAIPGHLLVHHSSPVIQVNPFPTEYLEAIKNIGFGSVIKFVLEFKKILWKDDALFIFSDAAVPTWWTQLPSKRALLTGWLGGPPSHKYAGFSEDELIELALESLGEILDITLDELRKEIVEAAAFNWQTEKYTGGGYSYAKVESGAASRVLQEPLEHTIFFAGEYINRGKHPGTVEAAFESAVSVADKIRSNSSKK